MPLLLGALIGGAVVGMVWLAVALVGDSESGGSGGGDPEAQVFGETLTGTLEAPECGGGYAITNASVEVRDETDTLIGASNTGFDTTSSSGICKVEFTVTGLPRAEFYQITIGTHGGPSYSLEEMEAANWHLELSLD
jgi:hypothetical protein